MDCEGPKLYSCFAKRQMAFSSYGGSFQQNLRCGKWYKKMMGAKINQILFSAPRPPEILL